MRLATERLPRALGLAIVLTASCIEGRAFAQEGGAAADSLAEQAFTAYEAGKYADAVGLYMKSFQLSGDARILYNVASIYDKKLKDRALAEDFYRRYLRSTTTEPELVKRANERLLELKNQRETIAANADAKPAAPPPAAKAAPPPKPAETASPWRFVGLGVAGLGLAAVGVGAGFGLSAQSKADDLEDRCPNDVCADASGVALRDDADTAATLSTVFFASGVTAVAGGLALFFLAPRGARTTGLRLLPNGGVQRAGLELSGSF